MTISAKEKARRARIRKVLRDVVKLLNAHNRELWNILTALRGPDSDHDALKERTTCQIRRLIGMDKGACGTLHVGVGKFADPYGTRAGDGHFNNHYRQAVKSLEDLGFKVELERYL